MVVLPPLNSRPSRRRNAAGAARFRSRMLDSSQLQEPTAQVSDADLANAIRTLAMDAVEAAKSGHPGMPMGMADIAVALWKRHLRHNPSNPDWPGRARFVKMRSRSRWLSAP